jgi:hypothetical protein
MSNDHSLPIKLIGFGIITFLSATNEVYWGMNKWDSRAKGFHFLFLFAIV